MTLPVRTVLEIVWPVRDFGSMYMVEQFVEEITYDDGAGEGGVGEAAEGFLERGRGFLETCVKGIFGGREVCCGLL